MTSNLVSFTVQHAHSGGRFQENTESALCAASTCGKRCAVVCQWSQGQRVVLWSQTIHWYEHICSYWQLVTLPVPMIKYLCANSVVSSKCVVVPELQSELGNKITGKIMKGAFLLSYLNSLGDWKGYLYLIWCKKWLHFGSWRACYLISRLSY